jgi:hypothetical protein|tara:strand:- start:128 stop:232 length:105 start_codon:yes stop_codon:yes gene_type:complete
MPDIHQIITEDPATLLLIVPVVIAIAIYFALYSK